MTTPYAACPFCGLRGCASPVRGAEAVSEELLAQLHRALAAPVVTEEAPCPAAAVPRPRQARRWARLPEHAAAVAVASTAAVTG